MNQPRADYAIIGGGLTGTYLGFMLAQNHNAILLEKSRGVGGRFATRRVALESQTSTHPYVQLPLGGVALETPQKSRLLSGQVSLEDKTMADFKSSWENKSVFFGAGTELMKWLVQLGHAKGLELHTQKRLERAVFEAGHWQLHYSGPDQDQSQQTKVLHCQKLILAIPAPQALAIIQASEGVGAFDEQSLASATMSCRWTWIVLAKGEPPTQAFYALENHAAIDSIFCLNQKPGLVIPEGLCAYQVSMNLSWSHEQQAKTKQEVDASFATTIVEQLRECVGLRACQEVLDLQVHKWLYAHPKTPLDCGYLNNARNDLFVLGDWAAGYGVDGAACSVERFLDELML